jgi:threonine/homoserine/homoserine lactone efflux protein
MGMGLALVRTSASLIVRDWATAIGGAGDFAFIHLRFALFSFNRFWTCSVAQPQSPCQESALNIMVALFTSLVLPYALMLMTPGPNLLIVLRIAMKPSLHRVMAVAAGIACGATVACFLAAFGASTFEKFDELETVSRILLAGILIHSAFRLIRRHPASSPPEASTPETLAIRLFALGLATALSNPLSVPFFVSFYLAAPSLRTSGGVTVACCLIFSMAFAWYVLAGRLFSLSAIRRRGGRWHELLRFLLAGSMSVYALWLLAKGF